jgi:hypothetical protein
MPTLKLLALCFLACTIDCRASAKATIPSDKSGIQRMALAREDQLWNSFLGDNVDIKTFGSFLAADYLGVDESGKFVSKEQTLQMLAPCTFFNYHISDPHIRIMSTASYLIAYQVRFDFSCSGKARAHGGALLSHAWKQVDGKWLLQLHAETNLPKEK